MISSGKDSCDLNGLLSQPTMFRLENRISKTDNMRIFYVFIDAYLKSFTKKPKYIVIDMAPPDRQHLPWDEMIIFI